LRVVRRSRAREVDSELRDGGLELRIRDQGDAVPTLQKRPTERQERMHVTVTADACENDPRLAHVLMLAVQVVVNSNDGAD